MENCEIMDNVNALRFFLLNIIITKLLGFYKCEDSALRITYAVAVAYCGCRRDPALSGLSPIQLTPGTTEADVS